MARIFLCFISIIVFTTSCGDDETCTASMLEGTYNGMAVCSVAETSGPGSLTVSADGNTLTIVDQDGLANEVSLEGCSFNEPEQTIDFFGIEIKISANGEFSGSTIEYTVNIETDGQKETCTFTGTK